MTRPLMLLCVLGCYVVAPGSSRQSTQEYGQWSMATKLEGPVNTDSNDMYATLSRDELTMYFSSDRPGGLGLGTDDLWVTTRASLDDLWEPPVNLSALNTSATDNLAVLSPDEHVMFFHSNRSGVCGGAGNGDIWMTRRHDKRSQDWETPVNLECVESGGTVNTNATEIAPALFENPETGQLTLFYGSNRPGPPKDFDVYASVVGEDGAFGQGALVQEFSSAGRDTRIFIRRDGLEAFITSDRAGAGAHGLIDIWTSTRDTLSSPWPTPIDVSGPVNSACDDGSPWLSRDGTRLYFFSARTASGQCGKRDIWYATREKIAQENTQATFATFWNQMRSALARVSH